jgi:hypothetical protein
LIDNLRRTTTRASLPERVRQPGPELPASAHRPSERRQRERQPSGHPPRGPARLASLVRPAFQRRGPPQQASPVQRAFPLPARARRVSPVQPAGPVHQPPSVPEPPRPLGQASVRGLVSGPALVPLLRKASGRSSPPSFRRPGQRTTARHMGHRLGRHKSGPHTSPPACSTSLGQACSTSSPRRSRPSSTATTPRRSSTP